MWEDVRESISAYRAGLEDGAMLLETSEAYFEQANKTVFSAEAYSSGQSQKLLLICAGMFGIMLLTWSLYLLGVCQEAAALESTNEKLNDLAKRDPLTGATRWTSFGKRRSGCWNSSVRIIMPCCIRISPISNTLMMFTVTLSGDDVLAHYGGILSAEMREGASFRQGGCRQFCALLRYREKGGDYGPAAPCGPGDRGISYPKPERAEYLHLLRYLLRGGRGGSPQYRRLLDRANFARKTVKNGTNPNYVYYNEKIRQRLWAEKRIENRIQGGIGCP